jgi:hypothetical protein
MLRFVLLGALSFIAGCDKDLSQSPTLLHTSETASPAMAHENGLTGYQACSQLQDELRQKAQAIIAGFESTWPVEAPRTHPWHGGCGDAEAGPVPPVSSAPAGGVEGVDYSGTNNQEKGVDEADYIKTDGKYFYVLSNTDLQILAIGEDGALSETSRITFTDRGDFLGPFVGGSFLITHDRAYVFTQIYNNEPQTQVDVVDLSADRKNPTLIKTLYFGGNRSVARLIGDNIHFATYQYNWLTQMQDYPELAEDYYDKTAEEQDVIWAEAVANAKAYNQNLLNTFDFLTFVPHELIKNGDHFDHKALTEEDCTHIYSGKDHSQAFLALISLSTTDDQAQAGFQWLRVANPTVYASPEQILVAGANYWWQDSENGGTDIHRFKLGTDHKATYANSVHIPGYLLSSFSLSEYQGYVRVAATVGGWENPSNNLYVLGEEEGEFKIISSLEGLAPGERIWSARFSKDKGFLVTFEQVDPLFTLDLSDPKNPRVAGELKVPGVSTYLQDIGDGQLLAIGYGSNAEGRMDWTTQISLFDVSDFTNPTLAQTTSFAAAENLDDSWTYSYSEATTNHLAVNYFAPAGMTAIPFYTSRYIWDNAENDGRSYRYEAISKLQVVNTKPGEALTLLGEVDHTHFYANETDENYWGYYGSQISRSYFVGDYLYAFSSKAVTATRLSDMTTTSDYWLH